MTWEQRREASGLKSPSLGVGHRTLGYTCTVSMLTSTARAVGIRMSLPSPACFCCGMQRWTDQTPHSAGFQGSSSGMLCIELLVFMTNIGLGECCQLRLRAKIIIVAFHIVAALWFTPGSHCIHVRKQATIAQIAIVDQCCAMQRCLACARAHAHRPMPHKVHRPHNSVSCRGKEHRLADKSMP